MKLPPNGVHFTLELQYRKCGKLNCKTCSKGKGHGPYWYAYWREAGRLVSGYIGRILPVEIAMIPHGGRQP